jgi:hypothetical protein
LITAANDANGPGSGTVSADPISKTDLYGLIDAANLVAMNTQQIALWGMIPDPVKIGEAGTQANLEAIFDGFEATLNNFANTYTRPAGPWEVYFGVLDDARNSDGGNQF